MNTKPSTTTIVSNYLLQKIGSSVVRSSNWKKDGLGVWKNHASLKAYIEKSLKGKPLGKGYTIGEPNVEVFFSGRPAMMARVLVDVFYQNIRETQTYNLGQLKGAVEDLVVSCVQNGKALWWNPSSSEDGVAAASWNDQRAVISESKRVGFSFTIHTNDDIVGLRSVGLS